MSKSTLFSSTYPPMLPLSGCRLLTCHQQNFSKQQKRVFAIFPLPFCHLSISGLFVFGFSKLVLPYGLAVSYQSLSFGNKLVSRRLYLWAKFQWQVDTFVFSIIFCSRQYFRRLLCLSHTLFSIARFNKVVSFLWFEVFNCISDHLCSTPSFRRWRIDLSLFQLGFIHVYDACRLGFLTVFESSCHFADFANFFTVFLHEQLQFNLFVIGLVVIHRIVSNEIHFQRCLIESSIRNSFHYHFLPLRFKHRFCLSYQHCRLYLILVTIFCGC